MLIVILIVSESMLPMPALVKLKLFVIEEI